MSETNCSIVTWNIRGLNFLAKHHAVQEALAAWKPAIACLQETKISAWNDSLVRDIGGGSIFANPENRQGGNQSQPLLIESMPKGYYKKILLS